MTAHICCLCFSTTISREISSVYKRLLPHRSRANEAKAIKIKFALGANEKNCTKQ
ncbi:hypothetical protein MF1_06160 [Bartonella quintana]|nr:hypothetical protein MF1_06160 [Bartonella quintana]